MSALLAGAALSIATALFDGAWEGVLIADAVWCALRCLPDLGAATRYAIWLCTLLALVFVPVLTIAAQAPRPAVQTTAPVVSDQELMTLSDVVSASSASSRDHAQAAAVAGESIVRPSHQAPLPISHTLATVATLVWFLVALGRGVLLFKDIRELAVIRRDARACPAFGAHGEPPVFTSHRVDVPLAFGFLRPAVVLPAALVDELPAPAIEAIVTHEIAHLRRYDVWTNALARVVEALLAFNPVASFIMRRLSIEREIACDDWVVARTGNGDTFARALATLACRPRSRVALAAPSAVGNRHAIVVRIERLLDVRPRRLTLSFSALAGTLMIIVLLAFVLQLVSPVFAYEQLPVRIAQEGRAPSTRCAVPNRGIGFGLHPIAQGGAFLPAHPYQLLSASELTAHNGAAHFAAFDLTVDASGKPRRVTFPSAVPYPGMAGQLRHIIMLNRFQPAIRNCVPVTETIRTGVALGTPSSHTLSVVSPSYPAGWSAMNASACKVPMLLHTGVPAAPATLDHADVGRDYQAKVRVHVNGAGAVTRTALLASSGQHAMDESLLAAARRETYPLTEESGFKQVRPSNALLSWNATHGSSTYTHCSPLPTDYVWTTTFTRTAPIGAFGTNITPRISVR